jgi:D-glycero-D-manno-heptose 1,7-bisphosphate phosphatase
MDQLIKPARPPATTGYRRGLFLDRDGVINRDYGYVHTPEDCDFTPGIFQLVRRFRDSGYGCVVVTNAAGIARGYFAEEQFHEFCRWLLGEFERRQCALDAVYYCPHHPTEGSAPYRRSCHCRKPQPGMILRGARDLGVDLADCVLVGDRETDIEAGTRAGISRLYLFEGNGRQVPLDAPGGESARRIQRLAEIRPQE